MIKRAKEVFFNEVSLILKTQSKKQIKESLTKLANLAEILDQSGDVKAADTIDSILKEAGFWSSLLSGGVGGLLTKNVWDDIKEGHLMDGLKDGVRNMLEGAGAALIAEFLISKLTSLPIIGGLFEELNNSSKLKMLVEGVIARTVANSDFVDKLVDNTLNSIEQFFGINSSNQGQENTSNSHDTLPGATPIPNQPSNEPENLNKPDYEA